MESQESTGEIAPSPEAQAAEERPAVFYRSLREYLRTIPGGQHRFWILVVATGALAGVGSAALFLILSLVQRVAWPPGPTLLAAVEAASPLRRVLAPVSAGLLITLVSLVWRQPLGGHGTARIIEAIWQRGRGMRLGRALVRGLLAIVSVGAGASLGREGALVQTGAAAGSFLASRLGVSDRQARVLVACGAASGIAAAYDVPIGGALFGLEVLLGSFALELLGPIVVSCVVAVIVARTLPVPHPAYVVPHYELLRPGEILLGLALAPVLGIASAIFVRVMGWVEVQIDRLPRWSGRFLPPLGMLAVGLAAIRLPQLPGNGFDTVHAALLGELPLRLLLVLPFAKLAATAICSGSGVPGGLFTPTLFVGATLGGAVGALVELAAPGLVPGGALALVGMAGVLAGTTHAAVSSVLIIFEMTGDYGVILPLMLSAAIAASISRFIEPHSLYTAPLRRQGVTLPELPRPEWLRATGVETLVSAEADRVAPDLPFEALLKKLLALPAGHDLYVTAAQGELLGVVRLDALKGTITEQANLAMIVASDVVDRNVEPITTGMRLDEVAARFQGTDLERLPVVDERRRLVGTVGVRDVLALGKF
jgi:CIC family chloride channel protein